jgi:hypothetical protein
LQSFPILGTGAADTMDKISTADTWARNTELKLAGMSK